MSEISRRGMMGWVAGVAAAPALVCEAVAAPGPTEKVDALAFLLQDAQEPSKALDEFIGSPTAIECVGVDLRLTAEQAKLHGEFLRTVIEPALAPLFRAVGARDWPRADFSVNEIAGKPGAMRFDVTPTLGDRLRLEHHFATEAIKTEAAQAQS